MDAVGLLQVQSLIRWLKDGPAGIIPISSDRQSLGTLCAVTWEDAGDSQVIERLEDWHRQAFTTFAVPLSLTRHDERRWLIEQVLDPPDRLLFWIHDLTGRAVGHAGLGRFDFTSRRVGLRDVLCGQIGSALLVTRAVETLRDWVLESCQMTLEDHTASRVAA